MKAVQIKEYGDTSVLSVVDVPVPSPAQGQVQVEVYASSINPIETLVREGHVPVKQLPITLGGDFSGVVTQVGEGVTSVAVGDKVYGQASVLAGNSGAYAEFAVTSATRIAPMPTKVSFNEAASLPLVGVSALQALITHLDVQAGQKLFIHGGAGGIGSVAVQVAKHMGVYVATTATGEGIDFVKQLGADQVIDYKKEQFSNVLQGFDAAYDLVGGDEYIKVLSVLKPGGKGVSMTAHPDEAKVASMGVTSVSQLTDVTTEMLERLARFVDEGIVKPQVDVVFALDDVVKAFAARESGTVRGKVVLAIKAQ